MATMDYEQENGRYDSMYNFFFFISVLSFLCSYIIRQDKGLSVDGAPQTMNHVTNVTEVLPLAQNETMITP